MKAFKNILSHSKQKGAALLTVLVALFLISLMTFELYYSVTVERRMAYNDVNQLKTYYLAKSGVRIGLLRLALYGRTRKSLAQFQAMAPGLNIKQYLEMIWALPLPAFPPTQSSLGRLSAPDKASAEKVLQETKVSEGQFSHVISSESGKINLNFLIVPEAQKNDRFEFRGTPKNLVEHTGMLLINLLDKFIKESERPADEYGNMKPEEVVFDIMDWVNTGGTRFQGGSKDAFYEDQKPPYKAKRGRFFSVEELRLVRSIDDHLYNKLRPYVTVYSYEGKLNLNEINSEMLKVLYPDFTEDDLKRLSEEKARIGTWKDEKTFVEFITNTLGRGGFKTLYPDEANYPFAVSSNSFLIESMGFIQRSGSQIQRLIRVAVTMTSPQAGQVDTSITNRDQCNGTPNRFWLNTTSQCRVKARSKAECQNTRVFLPPAEWIQQDGKDCCKTIGAESQTICIDPNKDKGNEEPNSLKILHWTEI